MIFLRKKNNCFFIFIILMIVVIQGFNTSMSHSNSSDHTSTMDYSLNIQSDPKIVILDNTALGLAASSGNGSSNNPYIIENKVIDGGGNGSCIHIENTDKFFILRNCLVFNSETGWNYGGIFFKNVENATLYNNTVCNNFQGIAVTWNSWGDFVINNTVFDNTYGIAMSGYDHQLINNTVYDNIYGIRSGYQNILRDNYLNDNSDYGISLYAKDGCILTGNRFSSCYLEIAGSLYEVSSHIISPNNTVNGKAIGYYVSLYNTSITTLSEQLILANCSFTTISGLNLSGGWKGLWLVKSNNNTIQGNSLLSNQKYGIHSSQSFNNTFTNNIINNSSIGFKIENSGNNIMDLNTITNNARGIYLNRDIGNRIKNSHINFNDIGIEILGSLQNYIHNNSLIGNGNGIKVNSAIFSDISEFNFIYNNTATNGDVGISLPDGSRNNEVINNSVNLNEFGISITSFSNNNLIKENYVEYNSYAGIYLSQAEFNTIINNTVTHNYYGIDISNSIRNNITKNTVNSNQYGLYLSGCLNEITWNLFIDNCEGIYVFDTSCNIIYQNTVINRDCEQPIPSFTWILMLFSLMCLIMVIQRKNSWLGKKK